MEATLRADPDFADAHLVLGDLLAASQQWELAIPRYLEALRVQPGSARAHLALGAAAIRQQAADLLRRLKAGR